MSDDTYNLALRMPKALIDRLDALVDAVRDSLDMKDLVLQPKVTRSTVARLALLRGVEMLEGGKGAVPAAPKPKAARTAPPAPKPAPKVTHLPPGRRKVRRSSRTKPPMTVAGVKIRAWRESAGLKQAEAADRLGVVQSHWSRIERGEMLPGDDVTTDLANLVGDLAPGDWTAPNLDDNEEGRADG
jgi:DNA-binding XRE family transcriptional regulator